jgi:hypothetical protein
VPDHLGPVIRCESHVSTRLRYVRKSVVISGSLIREETSVSSEQHRVSVRNVPTDLNVPNGALDMNVTESGAVLSPSNEKTYVKQGT